MNLTRQVLVSNKQKYLIKMANIKNIRSIHDVLAINKSTRNTPSNVVKLALRDVKLSHTTICDTPCKVLEIDKTKHYFKYTKLRDDVLVLYIHGGGFVNGFAMQGTFLMKALMKYFGAKCIAVEYPLSPENMYPIALEKLCEIYTSLLDTIDAKKIIVVGESAGSNLAVAMMLRLKQLDVRMPACAILPSGFYDLTCSNKSYEYNSFSDPSLTQIELKHMAITYVNGDNLDVDENKFRDPLVSPVFADIKGLPPLYLCVCKEELLYDDTRIMAEKCKAQNVEYYLYQAKKCFHAHMILGEFFAESKAATRKAVEFICDHTNIKLSYFPTNKKKLSK